MKITIIHTSRGRPQSLEATVMGWMESITPCEFTDITYRLGIEVSEAGAYAPVISRLQDMYRDRLKVRFLSGERVDISQIEDNYFQFPSEQELCSGKYLTANTKGNRLALESDADWLVVAADNLFPVQGWNVKLLPFLREKIYCRAILSYANQHCRRMCCHPIMTREFFNWNDSEIMYKGYYHTHGDVELYAKATLLGELVCLPIELNPTHVHPYKTNAPRDDLFYINNNAKSYAQAEPIWQRRCKEIFARFSVPVSQVFAEYKD
jgi:hypothetical protein